MRRDRNKTGKWVYWAVLCIGLLIIGRLLLRYNPNLSETISSYAVYPFLVIQHKIVKPYKEWRAERRAAIALENCIEIVTNERDQLLATVIAQKAELDYLEAIKELLVFKERYQIHDAIITQIIAKHYADEGHYFLVDAGQKHGVSRDMIAIYNNCLLGRVVEVYPLYSKVLAITDKGCKIASYCAQTKTVGIHEGENSFHTTSLKFVSHLKEIKEGDYLLSSGEGMIFPRGFGIGRISAYESDGLFYRIKVKPLVDLNAVGYCCLWQRSFDEKTGDAIADSWLTTVQQAQELPLEPSVRMPEMPAAPLVVETAQINN